MVESFTIGMTTAFLVRSFTLRILKWPLTSRPLYIIPEMIVGGLFFSLFDYLRRSSLEKTLKYEQMRELADTMRKNQANYGSNIQ